MEADDVRMAEGPQQGGLPNGREGQSLLELELDLLQGHDRTVSPKLCFLILPV